MNDEERRRVFVETMARGGCDGYEGPYCVTSTGEHIWPKAADLQAVCQALLGLGRPDPSKCDHDVSCSRCGVRWHTTGDVPVAKG